MTLAEHLHALRTDHALTLKALAHRSGLSVPYLSDLERSRKTPSLDTLASLGAAYGLTVQGLLRDVNFTSCLPPVPAALADLMNDPVLGQDIDQDWMETLGRIDFQGRIPASRHAYLDLYRSLRPLLEHEEHTGTTGRSAPVARRIRPALQGDA